MLLSDIMKVLEKDKQFHILWAIVTAHSMGGLAGLSALDELCLKGAPAYLKVIAVKGNRVLWRFKKKIIHFQ